MIPREVDHARLRSEWLGAVLTGNRAVRSADGYFLEPIAYLACWETSREFRRREERRLFHHSLYHHPSDADVRKFLRGMIEKEHRAFRIFAHLSVCESCKGERFVRHLKIDRHVRRLKVSELTLGYQGEVESELRAKLMLNWSRPTRQPPPPQHELLVGLFA